MSDDYVYPHSVQSLPVLPVRRVGAVASAQLDQAPSATATLESIQAEPVSAASTSGVPAAGADPAPFIQQKLVEGKVIEALREIFDPEIPVNIYELGLIYDIKVDPEHKVHIKMTLTAPACPVAGTLPGEVEKRVEAIPEVKGADVELVWEPPWSRELMSEAALLQLGMF